MTLYKRADGYPVIKIERHGYFEKLHYKIAKLGRLPMWIIYRPVTREYPGKWVARMFVTLPESKPTRFVLVHDTLEELRGFLPRGLTCMKRHPMDLPEIEETWI